jgi:Mg2+ and Co2+ transporter CorA
MQRLTAITVVIMVPNLVASIYGMNFTHTIPAGNSPYGFIAVSVFLGIMVAWGFIHSRMLGWL